MARWDRGDVPSAATGRGATYWQGCDKEVGAVYVCDMTLVCTLTTFWIGFIHNMYVYTYIYVCVFT